MLVLHNSKKIELKGPERLINPWDQGRYYMDLETNLPVQNFTGFGNFVCFPLVTILSAVGMTHVDYFSLDIQGMDFKVLKTFPFDDSFVIDVR